MTNKERGNQTNKYKDRNKQEKRKEYETKIIL